jgi:DNA-binding NtrC family response regulator
MAPDTALSTAALSRAATSTAAGPVEARLAVVDLPAAQARTMKAALGAAGIRASPAARNGIVLLDPRAPGAADHVRALAGPGRLLVLSPSPVPGGNAGWDLLHSGAADVVGWGDDRTGDDEVAAGVAERLRRWHLVDQLLDRPHVHQFLVGDSPAWRATLREAVEVASFSAAAVLLTGESGTGKERMAQLIHELDPRPGHNRLVILDASTIIPSLAGSEFFGHEKGAFTGASVARPGAFELADGGVLFLDEVGELPAPLQAELLRVIQEGTYKRVGSNVWRKTSFRLICATNRDLAGAQASGEFRRDFFHRISGCTLHLPALRERTEDIIPLVRHFFRQARPDREPPALSGAVHDLLLHREYRGNIRELRCLALQIIHRHLGDGEISIGDIPERERPAIGPARTVDPRLRTWVRDRLTGGDTAEQVIAALQLEIDWAASREPVPATAG